MATQVECEQALARLAQQLTGPGGEAGKHNTLDRTLSCHVPDLGVTFSGRLRNGAVEGMTTEPGSKAQIRFTASSDDLVALADGRLAFPAAWTSKRLKVDASFLDLLKLKSLL
jgi:predicted lipid carrier protein YhbT